MSIQSKKKVLVSVWNDFWGVHLAEGLVRAGFDVTYHHTGSVKAKGARDLRNWPAAILNRAGFKGWIKQPLAFGLARKLVDLQATQLCKKHDVFWGWSGCSLRALKAAKGIGIRALLERGSTHCEWQRDVVGKQFDKQGMSHLFSYPDSMTSYDKAEYGIADRICVPSKFVARTFPQFGVPESKLVLNPYGVDVSYWSKCDVATRPTVPFTFLYVASIGLRKGIHDLLEAWKLADLRHATLLFVGGVSREAQNLMKNLPPTVELRGFASHEEIRQIMSRCHAYVLPSYEEGLARSVLEAAAAELPPIITKETGATDVLEDGRDCWVVPSGQTTVLASTLKSVAANPQEAARRGEKASLAVRDFTWEAYGDRCANLLAGIL